MITIDDVLTDSLNNVLPHKWGIVKKVKGLEASFRSNFSGQINFNITETGEFYIYVKPKNKYVEYAHVYIPNPMPTATMTIRELQKKYPVKDDNDLDKRFLPIDGTAVDSKKLQGKQAAEFASKHEHDVLAVEVEKGFNALSQSFQNGANLIDKIDV